MPKTNTTASPYWLKQIRPLWLREKLFWHFYAMRPEIAPSLFEAAPLLFAHNVRMKLQPSDIGHRQIACLGYVERNLSRTIARHAANGGLLVDVGANYGYFTCLWAGASQANRAVSFEASPRNLAGLRHNVSLNGLESKVTVAPKAAGVAPGTMQFSLGPTDQTGWGGLANQADDNSVSVEVTSLDDYFKDSTEPIAVLKVDVEGADTWVIEGAAGLLREGRIGHIFFEQNRARMAALGIPAARAFEFLRECGYSVTALSDEACYACLRDRAEK